MAFCQKCGKPVGGEERVCPWCGVAIPGAVVTGRPTSRMEGHVQILGWLQIAAGILSLLFGLAMLVGMIILAGVVSIPAGELTAPMWLVQGVLGALTLICVAFGAVEIVAGVGLMRHHTWARSAVIVLSFCHLLNIPLGTLLGIYGLWVLMSSEGESYYRRVAIA